MGEYRCGFLHILFQQLLLSPVCLHSRCFYPCFYSSCFCFYIIFLISSSSFPAFSDLTLQIKTPATQSLHVGEKTTAGRHDRSLQVPENVKRVDHSKLFNLQTNPQTRNSYKILKAKRCFTDNGRSYFSSGSGTTFLQWCLVPETINAFNNGIDRHFAASRGN